MSTAGKVSRRVRTERTEMTVSEFQAEIFKLESTQESKNLLVFGDSNIGKTWLASTCPGRQMWFVGEPGWKSAALHGAKGYGRRISDSASAWAAVEWLEENRRYEKFNWLIVDGVSNMQNKIRFNYTAEAFDINPASRAHRSLPDRPDYFNTQNMLLNWISRLVDLPINLLITAHVSRTEKTDADLLVFPNIQGKVSETANAVAGLMDAVGCYEFKRIRSRDSKRVKLVRRLMWSQPMDVRDDGIKYLVGDKFDRLGRHMDFPTMPEIIAKIDGTEEGQQ